MRKVLMCFLMMFLFLTVGFAQLSKDITGEKKSNVTNVIDNESVVTNVFCNENLFSVAKVNIYKDGICNDCIYNDGILKIPRGKESTFLDKNYRFKREKLKRKSIKNARTYTKRI